MRNLLRIVCVVLLARCVIGASEYKVEQLQVLFRHGDRTLDENEIYETDPYRAIHEHYGYGQLTKAGKQRAHKIGQLLRRLYDPFLGDYKPNDVYAYSSDSDRTKISLQLVLAGMYPPTPSTSWSDSVDWQPIPTRYDSIRNNFLTAGYYCPSYREQLEGVAKLPENLLLLQKHREFFARLENATNIGLTSFFAAVNLYLNLHVTLSLDLPLPSWCSQADFDELQRITTVCYKALTLTERMRRTIAGPIVEEFLKAIADEESARKVRLYAGHDVNLQVVLDALNLTEATPPLQDFGSAIVLEKLRGPDDARIYVRMWLWSGVTEKSITLQLPSCEVICPLEDYARIVRAILPNEETRECVARGDSCNAADESIVASSDLDWQLSHLFAGSSGRKA